LVDLSVIIPLGYGVYNLNWILHQFLEFSHGKLGFTISIFSEIKWMMK